MIEPLRSGAELLEEISQCEPSRGSIAIWWLGQSGFLVKSNEAMILIDPYLSEHLTAKYADSPRPHIRMTRAPLRGGELSGIDALLASHKHSDHLDPASIPDLLRYSPRAPLILPASIAAHAESLGIPAARIRGMVAGEVVEARGFSIRAIPSAHEGLDTDQANRHLYLGFVIEIGGFRLYHSGDSVVYDGLADWIGAADIDVMFLPINGRDPARGVAGNMNAVEAVALANQVRPRFVVPHHYDMFTFNTVPVGDFRDAARGLAPEVSARVLQCAEGWEVRK
jgi:L-ascorbate metabolism protein UlaG (beta-lactamase superfamily)